MKLTKIKLQQIIKEELKLFETAGYTPGLGGAVPSGEGWDDDTDIEKGGEAREVDIGEHGPNSPEQLQQAYNLLQTLFKRDLSDTDMSALYDIATYIRNHDDLPDQETLEIIVKSSGEFLGDMPGAIVP